MLVVNQPSSSVLCDELVKRDLLFEYDSGRAGKIFAKSDEREEILNVKRGIISMFQVSQMPEGIHNHLEVITLKTIVSIMKHMPLVITDRHSWQMSRDSG